MTDIYWWEGFFGFVFVMMAIDMGIFNRKPHEITVREAFLKTLLWIFLALAFAVLVYVQKGQEKALEFLAGYLIEESLSVDNLFVFIMIFSTFKIPTKQQHKVLFWGILGALVFRAIMIAGGLAVFSAFHWINYVFGLFLVFTGIKLAFESEKEFKAEENFIFNLLQKVIPIDLNSTSDNFFIKKNGKWFASKLFLVVVIVEITDLIFALDSIPAVLAISKDPFIVYTSNVFAIMGLRSLYFALAGSLQMFHLLKYGVSFLLVFVGFKMGISQHYSIPIPVALGVIALTLIISISASLLIKPSANHSKSL